MLWQVISGPVSNERCFPNAFVLTVVFRLY